MNKKKSICKAPRQATEAPRSTHYDNNGND